MANLEQQFTADTARKIASSRKDMMKKDNEELSNKIVEYIDSILSGEIQKAIDKNVYASYVKIKLPKPYRKALYKLSANEFSLVKEGVNKRLTKNGFEVELKYNSWSCDSCLWKYLACTKYFNVTVNWHR